jgi:hypothetical protein
METRLVTYAVLAIAIGFALVSVLPMQLETLGGGQRSAQESPVEGAIKLNSQDAQVQGSAPEQFSAAQPAEPFTLGVFAVDLLIAVAVYFVAKRRL